LSYRRKNYSLPRLKDKSIRFLCYLPNKAFILIKHTVGVKLRSNTNTLNHHIYPGGRSICLAMMVSFIIQTHQSA